MWFDSPHLRVLIELSLAEDVGTGDHATQATLDPKRRGRAVVRAKSLAVVCGVPVFEQVLRRVDGTLQIRALCAEGALVEPGTDVIEIEGSLASILTGERTALNFLQHLSGIATLTRAFVEAVKPHGARIADTRKTRPGFRALDKYAVRMGGGVNHRTALDAGILVKENHTLAAGSVGAAIERARMVGSHLLKVEVEVETLADVDAALAARAEVILLDNMSLTQLREAVVRVNGRALIEASGNMTLDRVGAVAATGVDLISVGALTHSAPAADFSLRIDP